MFGEGQFLVFSLSKKKTKTNNYMEQNFFVNTSVLLIFFILVRTFFSSSVKPYQESLKALKYMASLSLVWVQNERI